ncbi:MAG: hydroxymethylbilane synthase [Actinobacteria bacterium]|nr:MAG: hydroxymethylbilane synthase [Actinomycetota bacterium]
MRIATRGSALALAQASWVAEQLPGEHELVTVTTSGDRGGGPSDKARWVDAVERALLDGEADLAVHSAKDVPAQLAPGTVLLGSPPREDPRDAVLGELRPGARVGTSSLRRRAQLLATYDDIEVVELRGNVDTRLRKLAEGEVDAAVLALAGLRRLGRTDGARPLDLVPAAGQGTLALQAREGAQELSISDPETTACLAAERAVVRVLEADCHSAVGAHCQRTSHPSLRLVAWVGAPDGSAWLRDELEGDDPEALGTAVAERLLSAGARELLS